MNRLTLSSPLRLAREVALEQHGIVTSDDLAAAGMDSSSVARARARGDLVRLWPRTYIFPELLDDDSHVMAACLSVRDGVASHRAAARLWGFDGLTEEVVELTVPVDARPRSVRAHRNADLEPFEITHVRGVRVTDPTRTLVDYGAVVGLDTLELGVEFALRHRLSSVPRLRWRLEALARKGRAGPAALRAVLDRRGDVPPTASELETLFVQCVRAAGLAQPERQHVVREDGRFVARVDLAYPALRLLIELDSRRWHTDAAAFQRDRTRQNALVLNGWRVLRFTWHDVVNRPEVVIEQLLRAFSGT